jgi:hypothetical protein
VACGGRIYIEFMQVDTRAPAPSVSLGQCVPEEEASRGRENKASTKGREGVTRTECMMEGRITEQHWQGKSHAGSILMIPLQRTPSLWYFLVPGWRFDNETPSVLQLGLTIILDFKLSSAASAIPCLNSWNSRISISPTVFPSTPTWWVIGFSTSRDLVLTDGRREVRCTE